MESGLIYYRARHFDPLIGQFLQLDPAGLAGGDANLYAYVNNDPYNLTDPRGLFSGRPVFIIPSDKPKVRFTGTSSTEHQIISNRTTKQARVAVGLASTAVLALADNLGWHIAIFCQTYLSYCDGDQQDPPPEPDPAANGPNAGNPPAGQPGATNGSAGADGSPGGAPHGNSRDSTAPTILYALYKDGVFQKWGVTSQVPIERRYPGYDFVGDSGGPRWSMREIAGGTRSDMLDLERSLVESIGGPMNNEPWSSSGVGVR